MFVPSFPWKLTQVNIFFFFFVFSVRKNNKKQQTKQSKPNQIKHDMLFCDKKLFFAVFLRCMKCEFVPYDIVSPGRCGTTTRQRDGDDKNRNKTVLDSRRWDWRARGRLTTPVLESQWVHNYVNIVELAPPRHCVMYIEMITLVLLNKLRCHAHS